MSEPTYLTVAQVCDLLQLSRSTVNRRLADGTFTRAKVGGAVRIPRAELDALTPPKRRRRAA
ncbi:MAG: helix-turn-helix domain-containing protein [Rhodoglobus sp.]